MTELLAFAAQRIFDSATWTENSALLVDAGRVVATVSAKDVPSNAHRADLTGILVPGFVDLQVNGGGGVLFNNQTDVAGIKAICSSHAQFGTTALLPTLITDTVPVNLAALAAGATAAAESVPGFLGLHLEGPHLAVSRKGAHDPALIRPMTEDDLQRLLAARALLPNLMVTVAAETVNARQITRLSQAGIIVSIGHSDATAETAEAAFAAGASQATHLFNAMSQMQGREPGVVGAALAAQHVYAGLIADGIHVHPTTIRLALAAKVQAGHIFLVTDAMSQTGTDIQSFSLTGRTVTRADGALRLENGTLAGADLDMIDAIHFIHEEIGLTWEEALRMASLYPARAIRAEECHGHLMPGALANFVELNDDMRVQSTWINGNKVHG